jgi:hypothetical protein
MARGRALVAILSFLSLTQNGCTLIGFVVGEMSDRGGKPVSPSLPPAELTVLRPGSGIQLQLRDGTRVGGSYKGLDFTRPESYPARWEAAVRESGAESPLPALGAGARVVLGSGEAIEGELLGVGPGFVSLRTTRGKEKMVALAGVRSVTDAAGRSASQASLQALIAERRVPLIAGLKMDVTPGGRQVVPYDEVVTVTVVGRSHTGRNTGLLLGAVVDVAVVALAAYEMSQPWESSSSSTSSTSCPLVDSFDGRDFVLDAEPLGGSVYRGAERTDVVRLDRAVATDGEYRLRLRNDQQEIDHVDALSLRVVDHAPGTEVVPGSDGQPYVVRGPVPPTRARVLPTGRLDRSDVPVAALLSRTDGETWASDFRGRDPDVPGHLRDGVELEFPRPAGVDGAVLLVRAGATALAPRALRATLALHGRDLPRFYERLERDPAARAAYERAREREVLPTVRVRDRSGWRVAGLVRDLPSLVLRDQAVPIDLRGVDGTVVRLRVDGPPGFWSLDRAVLATEDGTLPSESRVSLSAAVTDDGRDVGGVLARPDHRRHLLRPGQDSVTLRFPAPPPRPGWRRTLLLEATGYYGVIMPAEGEPRPEEFRRLVEEPGGVARFTLEWLRRRPQGVASAAAANPRAAPD